MNVDVIITIVAGAVVLVLVLYSLRFLYGYRIRDRTVEIVVFGRIPICRFAIENIASIQKATWRDLGLGWTLLRLGNRFASESVLITRRDGWFRRIAITPDKADEFIRRVQSLQVDGDHTGS